MEDDPQVRQILARWISGAAGFRNVSAYGDAANAIAHLPEDQPEVVLMDINLPGQSGIECVCQLKGVMPKVQFLMLTVYEDTEHIFQALSAGATGYLLKRTPRAELLAAIKQVSEGGSPMTSYIARKVVQAFQNVPIRDVWRQPAVAARMGSRAPARPRRGLQANCRFIGHFHLHGQYVHHADIREAACPLAW